MEALLTLHISLVAPPPGVDFGVQKGRGNRYETVQLQRSTGADLCFTVTLPANLSGPFVQGPPGARFLYLDIGSYAGQIDAPWSRRLKVPLSGITPLLVGPPPHQVATSIAGTAKDGGPTCATPKPFAGWHSL